MDNLKLCPFCGGNAVIAREIHRPAPELCKIERPGEYAAIPRPSVNDGWLVECEKCGARGPHEYTTPIQSRDTAAAAWNRRFVNERLSVNIAAEDECLCPVCGEDLFFYEQERCPNCGQRSWQRPAIIEACMKKGTDFKNYNT